MMRILQRISRLLASQTSIFVILVAIITFLRPELFLWVRGNTQTVVLGIIMLTMGMTLTPDDFKILLKRPWDIFIGAVAQYTIMPLLAFGLTKLLNKYELNYRDYLWTIEINDLSEKDRIVSLAYFIEEGNKFEGLSENRAFLLLILFSWMLSS